MGEIPTTTNKALGITESIINGAIMDALVPVLENLAYAVPQLAWLKLPVVNQIFTWLVGLLGQWVSKALQVVGIRLVITIQTNAEKSEYAQAEGALRAALLGGKPDEIQKAKAATCKAADSLVHWDGSSPVVS